MSSSNKCSVIHWFRKGLRIHDNPSLLAALEKVDGCHHELRPVFVLDPLIAQKLLVGPNRWRFLLQSLTDLDTSLRALGSRLYVIRGTPEEVFQRIFKEWSVKRLTFEADIEPYARERDLKIEELAKRAKVEIIKRNSHTLFNPEALIASNQGKAPLTYQKFLSIVEQAGAPSKPLMPPTKLPEGCQSSKEECSSMCMDVPTLADLNVQESDCGPFLFPGGETEAIKRMDKYICDTKYVCQFEKPLTSPNSLEPSTTVLSPYLKFGCLSPRSFYWKLKGVTNGKKHTQPPVSLMGQLMWREFYYTVGADTPNFDQMEGNAICTQVPWDKNDEWLEAWKHGRTGYPWIDAVMTQLRKEGWIHHLARHAVACFLTRGDLWISWEEGQKVFEELLLDADWALNAGNWMWLSASAFFHQFFRVYSPVAFPKKTDKTGEYVRKYVPVLAKLPSEFIYEPWNAPSETLRKAGCVLGKDYPHRIVIHEDVYKINIGRMSKAYKDNKASKPEPGIAAKRAKEGTNTKKEPSSKKKKR